MTVRTFTVTVPEDVYTQIEAQARSSSRSVDDLVAQTLTRGLAPAAEVDLPPSVQAELNAMEHLSDEALWAIARSRANDDKIALYDLLIARQNAGSLTTEGRRVLTQLHEEADALMVRKAHAYALLQNRGYTLPKLDELYTQTPLAGPISRPGSTTRCWSMPGTVAETANLLRALRSSLESLAILVSKCRLKRRSSNNV